MLSGCACLAKYEFCPKIFDSVTLQRINICRRYEDQCSRGDLDLTTLLQIGKKNGLYTVGLVVESCEIIRELCVEET